MLKATFILALVASVSAHDAYADNAYPAPARHAQLRDPAAAGLGRWDDDAGYALGFRYPTPTRRRAPLPTAAPPHGASTSGDSERRPWGRARACAGSVLLALLTGNPSNLDECASAPAPPPKRHRACEPGLEACGGLCIDPAVTSCEAEADMLVPVPRRGRSSGLDCPRGHKVCALRSLDLGCIDTASDAAACGGCPDVDGVDCTRLDGVTGAECVAGQCRALGCADGWELAGDECVFLGGL
ncbi:hypothetical protein Q8F55_003100 [Vanrija albida]|uniref:Protein CPL1-like domain-containing protein n=1 Tax=Vanrija albida TaxID=181172 RepID=A0ABR3QBM6_9TREE